MNSLLHVIPKEAHTPKKLEELLKNHPEIQFVSLVAVDLGNNHTDEKIPVEIVLENTDKFLKLGVQTDGSSVYLPRIADINNAKVDLVPDLKVRWFVDYNYDYILPETGKPVGSLIIPAYLMHDGKLVDSRAILQNAERCLDKEVKKLFKKYPELCKEFCLNSSEDIERLVLTTATELEFWVRTPDYKTDTEKLSASQTLKEQYWKRTVGPVRTALEESLIHLNRLGLEAEMGHKEVGGVPSKLSGSNAFTHIMEQLEIDWKYDEALQSADNEMFAKDYISDIFHKHGLEISFNAKPIEGVAGSGEHHHVGLALRLKNGKTVNLFTPGDAKRQYLSALGFGAFMGLLKNYEVINPFVTSTNDAFNRLKPGFEAPVCIVGSLGHSVDVPTRNRTVLCGLVRDLDNPYSTRFELRAPNPNTNSYLAIAAVYLAMLDGMEAAAKSGKTAEDLEREFSKKAGEPSFYLDTDRQYRSEEDVFEDFTQSERDSLFGKPPATVWENIRALQLYPEKRKVLNRCDVFPESIIESYELSVLAKWINELSSRIVPKNMDLVRECTKLHLNETESVTDLDVVMWEKINSLRLYLMKDSLSKQSLFTRVREAIDRGDYDEVSEMQLEMMGEIKKLNELYAEYRRNLFLN